MSPRRFRRAERGMTLVELLVAISIFGFVTAAALTFLRSQGGSFARGSDATELLQNVRYASTLIEQELRVAGGNVPSDQPVLVYADSTTISFNADLTSNIEGDPFAVYYDPDAPAGHVSAVTKADRAKLPNSSFYYPDSTYVNSAGSLSPAETITFFFRPDSTTSRTDDWVLMRQVNHENPEMIARNLLQSPEGPFFQYFRMVEPDDAPARVEAVPSDELPLSHSAAVHRSAADVGDAALIDAITGVRVTFQGTNGWSSDRERTRTIVQSVQLPNAGTSLRLICGDEPIFGRTVTATVVNSGGQKWVELTWPAAVDETSGEEDVVRYVIWRRTGGSWGDPFSSIAAGKSDYEYVDSAVQPQTSYEYAVAAQDCSPLQSELSTAGPVNIPGAQCTDSPDDPDCGIGNDG